MIARTWLFVPGTSPARFVKAASSGADEVICDLEDAVLPAAKHSARADVRAWLTAGNSAWVRVNAVSTPWYDDDVAAFAGVVGVRGLVIPKAESVAGLIELAATVASGVKLVALIESARGVLAANEIAQSGAVARLAFGAIDFAGDIDAHEDPDTLLLARSTLVLASRAADMAPPIDGVTIDLNDGDAAGRDALAARRLGFGGKLCIHPVQLAAVARAFRPSASEIEWAEQIVAGLEDPALGALRVGDQMVDKPVIDRARRILEAAGPQALA